MPSAIIPVPQVQRLLPIESVLEVKAPKPGSVQSLDDVFEASPKAPGIKRPVKNIVEEGYWLSRFLLDQQKRAEVQILVREREMKRVLNEDTGELSKVLRLDQRLKGDLQNIEKLKGWKRRAEAPDLKSNEQLLYCLLKLFSDRERVQLSDFLDVNVGNFTQYQGKIQTVRDANKKEQKALQEAVTFSQKTQTALTAAKEDRTKRALVLQLRQTEMQAERLERSVQLGELKVSLMGKKAAVFQHFITVGRKGVTPLQEIQRLLSAQVAPLTRSIKEWGLFARQCVELATDLSNLVNKHQNTKDSDEREEIEGYIRQSIAQIDKALDSDRALVANAPLLISDIRQILTERPKA